MQKFSHLSSVCAPMPLINVDTDMIIPKQFLKTIRRTGLGKSLFYEMRFDMSEKEIPDFILNQEPYRNSKILISGDNFGCGSSREHAPWALLDFGIRCIIAPSFADIFYNNCFKNGILPIRLPHDQVKELTIYANDPKNLVEINLESQEVVADGMKFNFEIDLFKKHCLINGLDDIGLTLEKRELISSFEIVKSAKTPWLFS